MAWFHWEKTQSLVLSPQHFLISGATTKIESIRERYRYLLNKSGRLENLYSFLDSRLRGNDDRSILYVIPA